VPIVTAVKVVDCSALAALMFGEPQADKIAARLTEAKLVAPTLLSYELANVCKVKCMRNPALRDAYIAVLRWRGQLGIEERSVDPESALALSLATGLTAYDASYLWLARHLDAELVTLDRKLTRVAAS
jgi:predicted nucleic acid-binding protein